MKRQRYSIMLTLVLTLILVLASCANIKELKKTYDQVEQPQIDVMTYGTTKVVQAIDNSSNVGNISWRDLFKDSCLEALIDKALASNLDMDVCRMRIEQAELNLKIAQKAFLPSVYVSPTGNISYFESNTTKLYNVPMSIDWQIDIFGNLRNAKKAKQVLLEQSHDVMQAFQCQLISDIASLYYQLLMIDRTKEILVETDKVWEQSVETQKALMQAGVSNRAAVDRLRASSYSIKTQIVDADMQISVIENAICRLLGEVPHSIARGKLGQLIMPVSLSVGVPLEVLQNRPDVRSAQKAIEVAFYNTKVARAEMFPTLTLGGTAGWMNGSIGEINPGKILLDALASLTAPIFAQGKLSANVKISKLEMEIAQKQFVKTVLAAGNDVNTALAEYQTADKKEILLMKETESLKNAYDATNELMNRGKATYLEVLTAQEALLTAQLGVVGNHYNKVSGLINLYIALGGGQ